MSNTNSFCQCSRDSSFQFKIDEHYFDSFAKMVAAANFSLSFCENPFYVEFAQTCLNPQYKPIPKKVIVQTMKKLYKQGKKDLIALFSALDSHVAICVDIWSEYDYIYNDFEQSRSCICITCHWIDGEWKLQKRVLAFRILCETLTADYISSMINDVLEEYGLCGKVFSIGLDNVCANIASIREFKDLLEPTIGGRFFHFRHSSHVLSSCMLGGLTALQNHIKPIKDSISYLYSRYSLMENWRRFCIASGQKTKEDFIQDPRYWNLTYELLNEFSKLRTLLSTFLATHVPDKSLQEDNWIVWEKFLPVLKAFNDATYALSSVYKPSAHWFLVEACNIVRCLQEAKADGVLRMPVVDMLSKWVGCYKDIPPIYLVAMVFDPRNKLDGLQEFLSLYYELLYSNSDDANNVDVAAKVDEMRHLLYQLCDEHRIGLDNQVPQASQRNSDQVGEATTMAPGDLFYMQMLQRRRASRSTSTELDLYFSVNFEFDDSMPVREFPILEWWEQHSDAFPILSRAAKRILATPASNVAVEQAFTDRLVLDQLRSSLSPRLLDVKVCVGDWAKADHRTQEIKNEYEDDCSDISDASNDIGSDDCSVHDDFYNLPDASSTEASETNDD